MPEMMKVTVYDEDGEEAVVEMPKPTHDQKKLDRILNKNRFNLQDEPPRVRPGMDAQEADAIKRAQHDAKMSLPNYLKLNEPGQPKDDGFAGGRRVLQRNTVQDAGDAVKRAIAASSREGQKALTHLSGHEV